MDLGEYNKHKHKFQTGDIIATRSKTLPSLIIQLLTKSSLSHVLTVVVFDELPNEIFLIQSSHDTGVTIVEAVRYLMNLKGTAVWVPINHTKAAKINPNYKLDILKAGLPSIGLGFDMNSLWVGAAKKTLGPLAKVVMWLIPKLYESLYCSAHWGYLMKSARLLKNINMTPQEAVSSPISLGEVPLYPNY